MEVSTIQIFYPYSGQTTKNSYFKSFIILKIKEDKVVLRQTAV
jgi:hypothetical protein